MNGNKYHKPFKDTSNIILNLYLQIVIILLAIKAGIGQKCNPFSLPEYGVRPLQCDNQRGSRCYIGCQHGYELIGNCFRICTSNGEWTGSEPQCINRNIQCPLLQVYDGLLEENCPRIAGTRCNVRCNSDQMQRSLLCQQNGQWSPEITTIPCLRLPNQVMSCPTIAQSLNLRLSGDCNPSKPLSVCYFSCDNNFILNGPSAIQCLNNGQWSANQPFCMPSTPTTQPSLRSCTIPPPSIENMGPLVGSCNPGYVNQPCIYTCNPGYALAGNPALICGENGQWQGSIPNCVQIFCKGLVDPTNGQVSKDCLIPNQNLLIGKVCTFSCNTNYQLRGSQMLICLQNGQWDNPQPTCEQIHCPAIQTPSNGKLEGSCNPGIAGSVCKIICPQGFVINGNNKTTCQNDGSWSVSLGICQQKVCGSLPVINNGKLTGVCLTNTSVKPGQMCAYECNSGYQLNGPAILECLDTGLWSNSVPSCIPSPSTKCAPLPIISCATMTGICHDAIAGQVCRYVCTNYETCSGDVELTCGEDATWQGILPSCESKTTCRSLKIQAGATFFGDCRPGLVGKPCTVICKSGYRLYGNVRTIICLQSGSWSNSVPRCMPIQQPSLFCKPIFSFLSKYTKFSFNGYNSGPNQDELLERSSIGIGKNSFKQYINPEDEKYLENENFHRELIRNASISRTNRKTSKRRHKNDATNEMKNEIRQKLKDINDQMYQNLTHLNGIDKKYRKQNLRIKGPIRKSYSIHGPQKKLKIRKFERIDRNHELINYEIVSRNGLDSFPKIFNFKIKKWIRLNYYIFSTLAFNLIDNMLFF